MTTVSDATPTEKAIHKPRDKALKLQRDKAIPAPQREDSETKTQEDPHE